MNYDTKIEGLERNLAAMDEKARKTKDMKQKNILLSTSMLISNEINRLVAEKHKEAAT